MNHKHIYECLDRAEGFEVDLEHKDSSLTVEFEVAGHRIELTHKFPKELLRIPKFRIASNVSQRLAHVGVNSNGDLGEVCIADQESTSINLECPERVYLDTVKEHVDLLTRLIENPDFNKCELLREFDAHWKILCRAGDGNPANEIFVTWDGEFTTTLEVRRPKDEKEPLALRNTHVARHQNESWTPLNHATQWSRRPVVGKAFGVRLLDVEPPPTNCDHLLQWYFTTIDQSKLAREVKSLRLHKTRKQAYWTVFAAPIPDGEVMFAIRWQSSNKDRLPKSLEDAKSGDWKATPYAVRALSRRVLVARGGGNLDLSDKRVLLAGCGSVGSQIAMQIASSGIGHMTILDPDRLSEKNLYRHVLSATDIGQMKVDSLAYSILRRCPWTEVKPRHRRLEEIRDPTHFESIDMIVIAIGSPTIERVFAKFCRTENLAVPVLNCWVEGYGIGGHAILGVPGSKGCWYCAYVDPDTLNRGLTSNLNFLKPGQLAVRNHGGCGGQYLPYSGISAASTAAMASNLAVRFLTGKVSVSSKVSWKGCDAEATGASLGVSRRYSQFEESLQELPLYDENCDVCET